MLLYKIARTMCEKKELYNQRDYIFYTFNTMNDKIEWCDECLGVPFRQNENPNLICIVINVLIEHN